VDENNPYGKFFETRCFYPAALPFGLLDAVTANYIESRAEATKQTPAQVIGVLVRRELAATR
jgi:hypothetical protein